MTYSVVSNAFALCEAAAVADRNLSWLGCLLTTLACLMTSANTLAAYRSSGGRSKEFHVGLLLGLCCRWLLPAPSVGMRPEAVVDSLPLTCCLALINDQRSLRCLEFWLRQRRLKRHLCNVATVKSLPRHTPERGVFHRWPSHQLSDRPA